MPRRPRRPRKRVHVPAYSVYTDERMEPTTPHSGHSALDPQSSAPGAEPAQPGRVLTRSASSVPRAASVQAAGVAAALSAPQVSADIESLVTEDDTPVDNMPSEKQQRLLTEPLYSSWAGPGAGRTFLAAANVGVFAEARNPAIVPDVFLSLDVQVADNWWDKRHRSYFVWEFGKPPDLVVEIVSNREGNEVGSKRLRYARMGVGYYVIYDPFHRVMREDVRVYRLRDGGYERQESPRFAELRLGMRLWEGEFEGVWWSGWLRWTDEHDVLIPMGKERAEHAERLMVEETPARRAGTPARRAGTPARRAGTPARRTLGGLAAPVGHRPGAGVSGAWCVFFDFFDAAGHGAQVAIAGSEGRGPAGAQSGEGSYPQCPQDQAPLPRTSPPPFTATCF